MLLADPPTKRARTIEGEPEVAFENGEVEVEEEVDAPSPLCVVNKEHGISAY
jgi:hypothetical protein